MKKYLFFPILACSMIPSLAWAQNESTASESFWKSLDSSELTLLIILAVILGVILLLLVLIIYLMSFMNMVLQKESADTSDEPSWWEKFKRRFVFGVDEEPESISEKKKVMADHSYDGITELDNFMPPWLQYIFIGTVIFGVWYFVYYSVLGIGLTGVEEYQEELRIEAQLAAERSANALASIDENSVVFDESPEAISSGKTIFEQNCAACHAIDGGGGVGPNLTDPYWIHGGGISDIFKVVKNGVIEKGMVPWEDQLTPVEIQNVSSYILTLEGTDPASPKAPQGELYVETAPEQNNPPANDSTAVAISE